MTVTTDEHPPTIATSYVREISPVDPATALRSLRLIARRATADFMRAEQEADAKIERGDLGSPVSSAALRSLLLHR